MFNFFAKDLMSCHVVKLLFQTLNFHPIYSCSFAYVDNFIHIFKFLFYILSTYDTFLAAFYWNVHSLRSTLFAYIQVFAMVHCKTVDEHEATRTQPLVSVLDHQHRWR